MADTVVHLLHRASQLADETFQSKAPVTSRQQVVLAAILNHDEPPTQTQLVDATGIDRSTMADLVRRLCKNGLVTRRRTRRDARKYAVALTDKGKEIAQRSTLTANKASDAVLERLPVKLRSPFVQALQTLAGVTQVAAE